MRWLLHGEYPPIVANTLGEHGHQTVRPGEVGLDEADALNLLKSAAKLQLDIFTTSDALAGAPYELRVAFPRTIVYLQVSGDETELALAVERLFERYPRLSPRRLYTLTARRVKIRQLPTQGANLGE